MRGRRLAMGAPRALLWLDVDGTCDEPEPRFLNRQGRWKHEKDGTEGFLTSWLQGS